MLASVTQLSVLNEHRLVVCERVKCAHDSMLNVSVTVATLIVPHSSLLIFCPLVLHSTTGDSDSVTELKVCKGITSLEEVLQHSLEATQATCTCTILLILHLSLCKVTVTSRQNSKIFWRACCDPFNLYPCSELSVCDVHLHA